MTTKAKAKVEDTTSVDTHQDGDAVTVDLYDANKGKAPRSGGPYLDEIEAEKAEIRRAKVEGREPDLDNPPAIVSTQLVPKSMLRETDTDKSHFSDAVEVVNEPVDSYKVEAPVNEPDPTQHDFNNDYDQVKIADAKAKLDALKVDKPADKPAEKTDYEV